MKGLLFLIPVILFSSCKTKVDKVNTIDNQVKIVNSKCPNEGVCSMKVQKNKSLLIKEDGTGALYPEIVDGDKTVILYTFLRKGPDGTMDGDYSETLHFEVPAGTYTGNFSDDSLKNVKLLFGKHCYCKGEAGYYRVEKGSLKVIKSESTVSFDLKFKMEHPSHELNNIVHSTSL
jgi:hypothetical protein